MNRQNTSSPLFWGLLAVPVLWGAVLLAGCYQEGSGLLDWLGSFTEALNHPFAIRWNEKTLPFCVWPWPAMEQLWPAITPGVETGVPAKNMAAPNGGTQSS